MERADICPKADSFHCDRRAVAVIDRIGGGWGWRLHVETAVSSDNHLETDHWWSDQHHLDYLGTIHFQLQGWFVSISLRSILGIVAAILWVQSGHHVVNFFYLGFQDL